MARRQPRRPGRPPGPPPAAPVVAAGVAHAPTPHFDAIWRYAAARHAAYVKRALGLPPPWTDDEILARYRFTCLFRAADRTTQYLIVRVVHAGDQDPIEVSFRTLLFKTFNRIATWEALVAALGRQPSWQRDCSENLARPLDAVRDRGGHLYTSAHIIKAPVAFGERSMHRNSLRQLWWMMSTGAVAGAREARTLAASVAALRAVPEVGPFLSWQWAIDLNYAPTACRDEREPGAVVAGPGAIAGMRKCLRDVAPAQGPGLIDALAARAPTEFARLGIAEPTLFGRRMTPVDVEHLLCEVGKYLRAAAPGADGGDGRTAIRNPYRPDPEPLPAPWFPPAWGINDNVPRVAARLVEVRA